ncbi:MAG TPA: hypothetical protein VFD05_01110 [Bacilli bacterium]|nr:hypothetical protein [Bacilli bacterium]
MKKIRKTSLLLLLPLMLAGCRDTSSSATDDTSEPVDSSDITSEVSETTSEDGTSEPSSEIPIEDQYDIESVGAPDFVIDYEGNIDEKDNKRNEFMDREQGFAVGTDNEFKFFPELFAYDQKDQPIELDKYPIVSVIEQKVVEEYTELTGEALSDIVTIDEENATYKFSEAAIGHEFRLTVRPRGAKYATLERFAVDFEFKVVPGFNVYTQDDLHHYDNMNAQWESYRTENELVQQQISGIVLQNDLKITADNFPDAFFYLEGDEDVKTGDADYVRVVGSIRDFSSLYSREIGEDEDFVFNGNYFNLDFSEMPYVVREGSGGRIDAEPGKVVSHATLITAGAGVGLEEGEKVGNFTLKNISLKGNANRTEEGEKSGGLIFNKMWKTNAHVYNNIATQAFTFYFAEHNTPSMLIEKTRAYDSFSSMLYSWGGPDLEIKDSELIGAGGPIIIADHVAPGNDGNEGHPSNTVITNSVVESLVSGTENWFVLVDATTAATQLVGLGAAFPLLGKNGILENKVINDINVPHFNLIAVMKSSEAQGPTSDKIRGTFQIDEGEKLDFDGAFVATSIAHQIPLAAPRFQSSGGEVAIFAGPEVGFIDLYGQPIPIYEGGKNHFSGDYINLYLNIDLGEEMSSDGFMGIVFGLID